MALPFVITTQFSLTSEQSAQLMLTLVKAKAQDLEPDRTALFGEFVSSIEESRTQEMTDILANMAYGLYHDLHVMTKELEHTLSLPALAGTRMLITASAVKTAYVVYLKHLFKCYLLLKEKNESAK